MKNTEGHALHEGQTVFVATKALIAQGRKCVKAKITRIIPEMQDGQGETALCEEVLVFKANTQLGRFTSDAIFLHADDACYFARLTARNMKADAERKFPEYIANLNLVIEDVEP